MGTIKSKMQKDIFKICRGRNCIKIIDGNDRNILFLSSHYTRGKNDIS